MKFCCEVCENYECYRRQGFSSAIKSKSRGAPANTLGMPAALTAAALTKHDGVNTDVRSYRLPSNYCDGSNSNHKMLPQRSSSVGSNGSSTCETLSSVSSLSPTASVLSASSSLSSSSSALSSSSVLACTTPGGTAIAATAMDGIGIDGFQLGGGRGGGGIGAGGTVLYSRSPSASGAMTANLAQSFTLLHHPQLHHHPMHHFREMLYAAHILGRGYYQPAGPLISPHVLPPVAAPPPQSQQQGNIPLSGTKSKQISTPLDSDPERGQLLPLPSSTSTVESPDSDVLITGGDLATFRYPTQQQANQQSVSVVSHQQNQQQQLHQQAAVAAAAAAAAAAAHQGAPPYPRSMHQMHYTSAYPPNYYSPYPGEAMCYSPPYQPYFPAKVYQSAPPPPSYRRYPPYYQPGPPSGPPPPSDIYDQSPPSGGQPPPSGPPTGTQLVPTGPGAAHTQHLEHYPGPPGYYTGYSPGGGGQCYTRSPYMEYPPQCPCPMQQSCPKNVHTGPHIGSNTSSGSNNTSSSSITNNSAAPITTNSISNPTVATTAAMAPAVSTNTATNRAISELSVTPSSMSNNSSSNNMLPVSAMLSSSGTVNANSRSNQQQQLNISRGPVTNNNSNTIQQKQQQLAITNVNIAIDSGDNNAHRHFLHHSHHHHPHLHHHHVQTCDDIELIKPLKSELKSEELDVDSKSSQYEEDVVQPPTPPLGYEKPLDKTQEKESVKAMTQNGQTNCAVEAFDLTISSASPPTLTPVPLVVGRKARIGKTMAREMVYSGAAAIHNPVRMQQMHSSMQPVQLQNSMQPVQLQTSIQQHNPIMHSPSHLISNSNIDHNCDPAVPLMLKTKIKSEQIKTEKDDDLSIVLLPCDDGKEQLNKIKTEPEILEETKQFNGSSDAVADDDIEITSPMLDGPKQRIKILEFHKSQCKKSPPNSYKSLIKQAEPKSYLCLSRKIGKRNRFGKFNKSSKNNGVRKRQLILTGQQKKSLRLRKKKLAALERRKQEIKEKRRIAAAAQRLEKRQAAKREKLKQSMLLNHNQLASSLDATTDLISRGYYSEPETRCTSSCPITGRKVRKSKTAEARSKSETKKPSASVQQLLNSTTLSTSANTSRIPTTSFGAEKSRAHKKIRSTTAGKIRKTSKTKALCNPAVVHDETSKSSSISPASSDFEFAEQNRLTEITTDTSANNNNTSEANNNNNDCSKTLLATTSSDTASEALTDNNSLSSNSTNLSAPPSDFVFLCPAIPKYIRHHGPLKRIRSRSKFGCRKRQKHKHSISIEVDETIQPTRPDVVPKWNNGWRWEGEPFQGPVFLNSDEPHVIRTCYPAMRHSEGDIIRPRDCVLLKANEDNELPYVAKVAHLWENPEDGEMMMSLLWYYRPEHTEHGRQRNDCPDEVYASRHRDHNSVACIEDKCYVLVFREYCRYRRRLRAAEEDIEDVSIVPKRPNYFNPRLVPENTNPELVMFCRRAYEFRTKRLLKMPNKHDHVTRSSN